MNEEFAANTAGTANAKPGEIHKKISRSKW